MINVSTYTNVATSLLRVYQGYTRGIRFLLVMFLTLTVTTNAWGATLTLNNLGSSLSTTSNSTISTTTITATGNNTSSYIINYLQCKKQTNGSSHAMLLAKSGGAFISNKTAMPGNIKSVTVYVLTGAASKTTYHCAFSTTECTSAYTTGSTAVNITGGNSNKYTCTVSNAKYFCISLGNANNGQVYKLDVEYEVDTPPSCTTNPTVSAGSHSNVTTTTATVSCSGGITSLGSAGCSIESYGFVYGTSSNPTISNTKVQVGTTYTTTGTAFSKELTGLTANTTYYVRPYATNGNGTAYGTQTSFKTLEFPKYTVTLVPGSGSVTDTELEEPNAGEGVTLPTPTLDCGDWTFAGWAAASVGTETTTKPTLIAAGAYSPTSDITLYAVYQRTETIQGGGSGNYELVTSAPSDWSGTYLIVDGSSKNCFNGSLTALDAGGNYTSVTISDNTITSNTTTDSYSVAISKSTTDGKYYIKTASGYYIGSTASTSSDGNELKSSTSTKYDNSISINSNNVTIKGPDHILKFFYQSGQSWRFRFYKSTTTQNVRLPQLYKKSSGSTTTYYHSTPECGTPCTDAVNVIKGTPINGSFTMVSGYQSTCNGPVTVTLSNIEPATGYQFSAITQSGVNAANVTIDNTAKTVTYAKNTTGTSTINVTFTEIPNYTVTWNNNSETDEVTYNHGDALVVPAAPVSCDGVKEFVGWTALQADYYHATDAPSDIFTTTSSTVTANATYYAVFATPPSSGGAGSVTTVEDKLTRETTGISSGAGYGTWSDKKVNSAAVYAGQSAGGNDAIQIRSDKSTSGIVTTTSGGKVTHVEVDWESNTASDRTLDIYGRNVAYSDATDLYSTSTQGTKLGSIVHGTSTEFEVTGNYEYIGLRSKSGAMYLTSVTITWSSAGGSSSYTDYTTICQEVTGIAISGSYPTTFVQYDSFSFAGGIVTATFENGTTQDVTSLATFSGYNMDEVGVQTVTVTYMGQTAKYEITINQSDRWRLTWNVSGKTNTGARPIYVQKGSAIGTLPVPEVPAACAGKTFMGWTESNVVPSDGKGIVYITEETVPTKNTTYYAVFATINNFSTQAAIEDIKSGSKVVIVAVASMDASGGAGQAISSRTISITSKGIIGLSGDEVSIFDETINTPHSTCIWTLTKEGGGIVFEQGEKYIRAVDNGYRRLLLETTKDYWTLSPVTGKDKTYHMQSGNTSHYVEWFDHTDSKYDEGERYIGFIPYTTANNYGDFDMQFYVTANADGNADITDYTTGCAEYTITYYGFRGGYSTSSSSDGTIVLPVNSLHTVPDCGDVVKDHTNLGREFLNVWMTKPHGGHTFKPGDTFILTQDTTLYAQWKLETNSDLTTLPTDIEDLAGTDVYVYGGKTLNIQPGTTTINSLTLKGGLIGDGKSGNYAMPSVWVPEGATLVRNSNKIYLDLVVNAKTWYPFAVPFETKNTSDIHYLHPDMKSAAKYSKHFDIKTYDGARRADVGEDKANNWVRLKRHTAEDPVSFKPGVGYIISAMAYPGTDTATIRIPMSVPNTWFKNGEQAVVGTTVRNTIAVTAHTGPATDINNGGHQRHAGWNFVANPYLSYFTGGGIDATNGLDYIDGELIIQGSYEYSEETVPYVTIPAYNFAYYSQHKLSDVKLSPEYSFFVQIGTSGTMNFTTEGRQQAPAALRSNMDNPRIETDIVISHNQQTEDHTGLIIDDRYTTAYEIGADLEKMFGSAYNTTIYTLGNDVRLAYNALSHIEATIPIPLGFRAETDGEYTISLTNPEDILTVESIVLQDSYNNTTTNLLLNDYTFYTDRTQDDQRFVVYIVPHNNAPTDISTLIDNDTETRKVIHNHRLYIIHNGHVYDGVGQTIQ